VGRTFLVAFVTGVLVCIYILALPTVRHSYILYSCVYVCVSNGRARRRKETHPTIACYRCVRKRKRASSLANCSIAAAAWARRTTCLSPFVVQVTVLRADAVALWAICTPSKIGACARGSCSGRVAFVGCHVRPHDHHYVPRAHAGTAVTVSEFVGTLTCPDVLPICSPGVHDAPSDVNLTGTLAFSNAVYTFPLVAGARARGNRFGHCLVVVAQHANRAVEVVPTLASAGTLPLGVVRVGGSMGPLAGTVTTGGDGAMWTPLLNTRVSFGAGDAGTCSGALRLARVQMCRLGRCVFEPPVTRTRSCEASRDYVLGRRWEPLLPRHALRHERQRGTPAWNCGVVSGLASVMQLNPDRARVIGLGGTQATHIVDAMFGGLSSPSLPRGASAALRRDCHGGLQPRRRGEPEQRGSGSTRRRLGVRIVACARATSSSARGYFLVA
jgi:hypothetical protein